MNANCWWLDWLEWLLARIPNFCSLSHDKCGRRGSDHGVLINPVFNGSWTIYKEFLVSSLNSTISVSFASQRYTILISQIPVLSRAFGDLSDVRVEWILDIISIPNLVKPKYTYIIVWIYTFTYHAFLNSC